MAVAGLLSQYMSVKAQLSYVELQDTRWNNLATAMSKKLSEQEKGEEKWDSAYDSAEEVCNDSTKELKLKGKVVISKNEGAPLSRRVASGWVKDPDKIASQFASKKVPNFNPDLLDEYTDLDMEYSTMVAMYDTLLEELQAQADGLKDRTSTEAQDTHILGQ